MSFCIFFTEHKVKLWNTLPMDLANNYGHEQIQVLIMKIHRRESQIEAKHEGVDLTLNFHLRRVLRINHIRPLKCF